MDKEDIERMQRLMADPTKEDYLQYVANRFEVIDHTNTNEEYPRRLTKWDDKPFKISLSFQDDGRTLKVFLLDLPSEKSDSDSVK